MADHKTVHRSIAGRPGVWVNDESVIEATFEAASKVVDSAAAATDRADASRAMAEGETDSQTTVKAPCS